MTERILPDAVRIRSESEWCLFLDRDGVVNTRIFDGYVRTWSEFEFVAGALQALRTLAQWAPRIVIVTNQQGIGKGLMTANDLVDIHERMRLAVSEAGGRIDAVQFCPHLGSDACDCRKPNIGMATDYLDAHPEIDSRLSAMVGDTEADIEMGTRLAIVAGGCLTVRIAADRDPRADLTFASLADFAISIEAVLNVIRVRGD